MRDQKVRSQPSCRDVLHKKPTVARVHTSGFKGKIFAVHGGEGEDLVLLIHGHQRHHGVGPCDTPRCFKRAMAPGRLDDSICAPAVGKGKYLLLNIILSGEKCHVGKVIFPGNLKPMRVDVDENHCSGPQQLGALGGAQTHRAGTQDGYGISLTQLTQLRTEVAAGEDITDEEGVLVGDLGGDVRKPCVGKGNTHQLGLTPVNTASQFPAAMDTVIDVAAPAKPARTAECLAVGADPVAHMQINDTRTQLHNLANKLVAQDGSGDGARDSAVTNVEVTGADGGAGHPHDGITGRQNVRVRPLLQTQIIQAVIDQSFHATTPLVLS